MVFCIPIDRAASWLKIKPSLTSTGLATQENDVSQPKSGKRNDVNPGPPTERAPPEATPEGRTEATPKGPGQARAGVNRYTEFLLHFYTVHNKPHKHSYKQEHLTSRTDGIAATTNN